MFGFLKNILRRPAAPPAGNQEPTSEMDYDSAPPPVPVAPAHRAMPNRQNGGRGTAGHQTAPAFQPGGYQQHQNGGPQRQGHPNGSGKGIEVPLQKILEGLPMELQPRVRNPHVGDATISIPLEKVLSQLSRGAVRLSFGELRQAAPGVFSSETDRDRVLVQLPLNAILTQLNPALITRRRVQKQVEVPDDISSPFESQSQSGLSFSTGQMQTPKAPPPPPTRSKSIPGEPISTESKSVPATAKSFSTFSSAISARAKSISAASKSVSTCVNPVPGHSEPISICETAGSTLSAGSSRRTQYNHLSADTAAASGGAIDIPSHCGRIPSPARFRAQSTQQHSAGSFCS